jgi:predicted nucleic acid-binding protein
MNEVFADSFYYLALLIDRDEFHEKAVRYSMESERPMVTTAWVLVEVADAMAEPVNRPAFVELLSMLESAPDVRIIPSSQECLQRGLDLYRRRMDKERSLTDCISFVVMGKERITEALTGDQHFAQAGFQTLLK